MTARNSNRSSFLTGALGYLIGAAAGFVPRRVWGAEAQKMTGCHWQPVFQW